MLASTGRQKERETEKPLLEVSLVNELNSCELFFPTLGTSSFKAVIQL